MELTRARVFRVNSITCVFPGRRMNGSSDFFTLFLAVSRRLESIAVRLGPPLSIEESQILTLIHTHNSEHRPLTAQDIADSLKIEKSSLSRKLARLVDAGLLHRNKGSSDRREKLLELSPPGISTLESDQQTRNKQVEEFSMPLAISERRRFTRIVKSFADNLGAAEISMGLADHPLKVQITRLTRSLGFLGANLFETGFPLEECQMLSVIHENPEGILLSKLKDELPYDKSKMSRLIQAYEERGITASKTDSEDKRKVFVMLTKKGVSELAAMQASSGRLFDRGLSTLNLDERDALKELLERVIDSRTSAHDGDEFEFKSIVSEHERKDARTFLLQQLSRLDLFSMAPATLAPTESKLLAAFRDGKLLGILEWTEKHPLSLRIENLLTDAKDGFGVPAVALIEAAKQLVQRDENIEIGAPYFSDFIARKRALRAKWALSALNFSSLIEIISKD